MQRFMHNFVMLINQKNMNIEQATRDIDQALTEGKAETALQMATALLDQHGVNAHWLYQKGKAYMKMGLWAQAISAFLQAEELDPTGPARECRQMLDHIMAFYNKDMYNH